MSQINWQQFVKFSGLALGFCSTATIASSIIPFTKEIVDATDGSDSWKDILLTGTLFLAGLEVKNAPISKKVLLTAVIGTAYVYQEQLELITTAAIASLAGIKVAKAAINLAIPFVWIHQKYS